MLNVCFSLTVFQLNYEYYKENLKYGRVIYDTVKLKIIFHILQEHVWKKLIE